MTPASKARCPACTLLMQLQTLQSAQLLSCSPPSQCPRALHASALRVYDSGPHPSLHPPSLWPLVSQVCRPAKYGILPGGGAARLCSFAHIRLLPNSPLPHTLLSTVPTPRGLSAATPSLVHLAQQLLGQTLRSGHNHIPSDAAAAAAAAASAIASAASAAAPAAAKGTSKAAAAGANREAVAAAVGGEGVHDSREDACAAISLVQYELKCEKAGRPTGPLDPPVIMVRALPYWHHGITLDR